MAVAACVAVGLGEEVALGRGVAEAARVAVVAVGQAVTACEPLVAVVVPVPGVAVAGRDAAAVGLGAAV